MKPRGEGYFPSSSTSRMVSGGLRPEAGLVLALELERSAAFCTQASCQALRPPERGNERNLIASMRPAMAAPSEGVNGSGVQALTAARTPATIFSLKPGSAGARI